MFFVCHGDEFILTCPSDLIYATCFGTSKDKLADSVMVVVWGRGSELSYQLLREPGILSGRLRLIPSHVHACNMRLYPSRSSILGGALCALYTPFGSLPYCC